MICENCGKEHNGSYGSGRFCNKSCAIGFSNKNRKHSENTKKKISESVLKYFIEHQQNRKSQNINKQDNRDTKHKFRKSIYAYDNDKIIKYKICPICGSKYEYIKNEHSHCTNEFCLKHGIQQFRSLIKYFGFDKNKLGTFEVENEFLRIKNMLSDLYWNQHKSSTEICKMFNYPNVGNLTAKVFTYLGITIKSCHDSLIENYLENRLHIKTINNIGKPSWHTAWNGKEVYLRSTYELDYAKQLDEQKIDYEVEDLRIKYWDSQRNDYRCAIPDFYIPSENLIVEIKSDYTLDIQNMKDKKKAYIELGYNFKCICDYKEIDI